MKYEIKNLFPLADIAMKLDVPKSTLAWWATEKKITPVLSFPNSKIFLYDIVGVKRVLTKARRIK